MTLSGLEPPTWCHELLAPFGQNPWGEDIWRVVWAPRRICIYGGYWNDKGTFEYRYVPRYGKTKAFILERFLPTRHFGSPQNWAVVTGNAEGYLSNGPYPAYGIYMSAQTFAVDGKYIPLLPDMVLLTVQAAHAGRVRKNWEIKEALLSEEKALEYMADYAFETKWDETHGVRRGVSFSKDGAIQNNNADVEEYKQKLASSGIQVQKKEFQPGFRQAGHL